MNCMDYGTADCHSETNIFTWSFGWIKVEVVLFADDRMAEAEEEAQLE